MQALETRAAAESLSLKDADTIIKDVKLAVGTMGPLPTPQDREDVTVRLQAVRAAVQPRLEELRNAEEWKRWANVQVQEELCTKMEALIPLAEADPAKTAEEMRALQEKWKPVAAAPRRRAKRCGPASRRRRRRSTRSARTSSRSRRPNARRR